MRLCLRGDQLWQNVIPACLSKSTVVVWKSKYCLKINKKLTWCPWTTCQLGWGLPYSLPVGEAAPELTLHAGVTTPSHRALRSLGAQTQDSRTPTNSLPGAKQPAYPLLTKVDHWREGGLDGNTNPHCRLKAVRF